MADTSQAKDNAPDKAYDILEREFSDVGYPCLRTGTVARMQL